MIELDYVAIGYRVREKRKNRHLTQEKLAEMTEITSSFVGHIERGEKKASLQTMVRIAVALGTTTDYLLTGEKKMCEKKNCALFQDV